MTIYMTRANYLPEETSTRRNSLIARGHEYYQDKIKKLLIRKDVQKCLLGFKTNPKAVELQLELSKVEESAPEQAKALI